MLDRNFTQIWSTVKISWKGKVFSPVPISWSMIGIVAKCQNVIFFPKHYYETSTVTKLLTENFVLVSFPRREWYFKIFAWTLNNNNNDCYYFSLSFILITLCIKLYIDYYFTFLRFALGLQWIFILHLTGKRWRAANDWFSEMKDVFARCCYSHSLYFHTYINTIFEGQMYYV